MCQKHQLRWQSGQYALPLALQLVFEAKTDSHKTYHYSSGYSYYHRYGNIAIDDVYVFNSSCKSRNLNVLLVFLIDMYTFIYYFLKMTSNQNWMFWIHIRSAKEVIDSDSDAIKYKFTLHYLVKLRLDSKVKLSKFYDTYLIIVKECKI